MRNIICVLILWSTVNSLSAERIQFQSGTNHCALIELYTSEGCSSCPPAEEWLSQLKDHPRLWVDFVPIAFHVDYWDYLGWRDPFGAAAYSDRQRAYAAEWKARSVYTPAFVLDGKEWRGWSSRDEMPRGSTNRAGSLTVSSEDKKVWSFRFEPANPSLRESYVFHVALLGFGLNSDVKSGENRGRKLGHDFVVRAMNRAESSRSGNVYQALISLPNFPRNQGERVAIASWLTRSQGLEPLQAVGGWLPEPNR